MTTLFQNGDRFRSGKIYHRRNADLSVKWLLDVYLNLHKLTNITIVPVMISYDRIFEQGNLSQEMITGEQKDYSLSTTFQSLLTAKQNQFGETFVKYLAPINLGEFLQGECQISNLDQTNFEVAAVKLTEHLLRIQQKNTPITLNSIVSACMLQEEA